MARSQKTTIAQLKVGILVTIALLLLSAVILQQSWEINLFTRAAKGVTYLPDVGGLKPGAPVWLAGIEIGKVTRVSIVDPETYEGNRPVVSRLEALRKEMAALNPRDPEQAKQAEEIEDQIRSLKPDLRFVEVQLQIRRNYIDRISRDSEVSIESKGLIGDSFIEISPGTYGVLPSMRGDAYLIEGVRATGFREIMTGANDVIANFGVLSDQFKNIALKINPERVGTGISGTIQDLQDTMKEARGTLAHATRLVDEVREGPGTLAKLISDPTAYNRITESLTRLNRIADQIENGSGTLSRFIQNPQLYDHANEALRKVDVMMDRVERGEGTLGMLSKDPSLYQKTSQTLERFASFLDQIEKGEGTLGRLYKDPTLYENLNQSTAEITKLIYDLRQDPKKYLTIRFRLF